MRNTDLIPSIGTRRIIFTPWIGQQNKKIYKTIYAYLLTDRLCGLDLQTLYCVREAPEIKDFLLQQFKDAVEKNAYDKQEKLARQMHDVFDKDGYMMWTVCSIQLQVLMGKQAPNFLSSAQDLLEKQIRSCDKNPEDILLLYISVLEQQDKYTEGHEFWTQLATSVPNFCMKLAKSVPGLNESLIKGRLLAHAHEFTKSFIISTGSPDDWECFRHYLSCLLKVGSMWLGGTTNDQMHLPILVDGKSRLTNEEFESCINKTLDLLQSLQLAVGGDGDKTRFFQLAELEIERRRVLQGTGDMSKLTTGLTKYFDRFGHLTGFTPDIEMFLQILTTTERRKLLEYFSTDCSRVRDSVQSTFKEKHFTSFKIKYSKVMLDLLSENKNTELEASAVAMIKSYAQYVPVSQDLDPQENSREEFLSMACNVLVQLYWRTHDHGYLLEAILILEFGLTIRRNVSQDKILLVHLYTHLGAFRLAYEWYRTLENKNILLENVFHHVLPQMLTSPFLVDSNNLLEDYLAFMTGQFKESADLIIKAYSDHNYLNVIKYAQCRNRLESSQMYLMACLEDPILQLKQKGNKIEDVEDFLKHLNFGKMLLDLPSEQHCKSLTFIEDMQTRPWWTPTPDINYLSESTNEREARLRHANERGSNIKRKSVLPRMIHLALWTALFLKRTNIGNKLRENSEYKEFRCLLLVYAESLGFSLQDAVNQILAMSNGAINFQEVSSSDIVDWMNLAVFQNACNLGSYNTVGWHTLDQLVTKFTQQKIMSMSRLSPGVDLTLLVQMVTGPLTWHCLFMESCIRCLSQPGCIITAPKRALYEVIMTSLKSFREVIIMISGVLETRQVAEDDIETIDFLISGRSVFKILDGLTQEFYYEGQVFKSLQSWDAREVKTKMIKSQEATFYEFLQICQLKLEVLKELEKKLAKFEAG